MLSVSCEVLGNVAEPKSIRQILRDAGVGTSGQKRKLLAKEIDNALFALWLRAIEAHGKEYAACIMATVLAKDPTYEPDLWLRLVIQRNRAAIEEAFRTNKASPY